MFYLGCLVLSDMRVRFECKECTTHARNPLRYRVTYFPLFKSRIKFRGEPSEILCFYFIHITQFNSILIFQKDIAEGFRKTEIFCRISEK